MLWWFLLAICALYAVYKFIQIRSYWPKRRIKQDGVSLVWNAIFRRESLFEIMKKIYNISKTDRYVGIHQIGIIPTLVIRDPELIKVITVKDFDHFLDHNNFIPEGSESLFSNNLFALRGEKWRDMRSTLSPVFTSSKMKQMFVLMNETSEQFINYFLKQSKDVIEVELKDIFTRYCNDIIASIAFGVKVDSLEDPENDFYKNGKEVTNFSSYWLTIKFFGYIFIPQVMKFFNIGLFPEGSKSFFKTLVTETIQYREKNHVVRADLINLFMEARKNGMIKQEEKTEEHDAGFATVQESTHKKKDVKIIDLSDDVITSQAFIFFFAGFDAVSTQICFTVYELTIHPDIQKRLFQEIEEVARSHGRLTYEALAKMKYLDMIVSESLRKWPFNVGVDRACTKPYTIEPVLPGENPVQLNTGDVVFLPIAGLHYDPNYFPEPERFDPERFNDENKGKIKPCTYIPFGSGPRNCIASRFALLETKVLVYHLVKNFELVPVEKTPVPIRVAKKSLNLSIVDGGFWVGFKRRN